ncbi:LacI family transcriptional regulator [Paenibacillus mesophilus]|uniref:LacI family DNA-binding transcriptional regulator n=1 Tax=Paenibacillus mesophilus TaxID=2582849 RepID=UPI00110E7382|nr:LacI family DNA-binding transcriptional regulator [Paenibacillus mesophilus]TMV45665.1 LacI family transcriptional regulator [Paenibacillus mesophilus]
MKVTIKDIAREAGVSHPTVSKALNGAPGVSEDIRKKIVAIADRLNYVPNLAAKRLVDRKTNSIGLIWPKIEGLFFYHLGLQIQKEAASRGLDVIMSLAEPPDALRIFNEHFVDEIVFWCPPGWLPSVEFIKQRELFHGNMLLMGGGRMEQTHYIGVNRKDAAYEAVRYLASQGHRKLTFLGNRSDKLTGFTQGLLELRLDYHDHYFVAIEPGDSVTEDKLIDLFESADRPTAFVVDSQTYAFELLKLFRKRKIRIPQDFSLVVYDDIPEMERMEVPLTTVGPSIYKLATAALDILTGRDGRGEGKYADVEIGCEMHIRKSVGRIQLETRAENA